MTSPGGGITFSTWLLPSIRRSQFKSAGLEGASGHAQDGERASKDAKARKPSREDVPHIAVHSKNEGLVWGLDVEIEESRVDNVVVKEVRAACVWLASRFRMRASGILFEEERSQRSWRRVRARMVCRKYGYC